jgi:hypothetical protein
MILREGNQAETTIYNRFNRRSANGIPETRRRQARGEPTRCGTLSGHVMSPGHEWGPCDAGNGEPGEAMPIRDTFRDRHESDSRPHPRQVELSGVPSVGFGLEPSLRPGSGPPDPDWSLEKLD